MASYSYTSNIHSYVLYRIEETEENLYKKSIVLLEDIKELDELEIINDDDEKNINVEGKNYAINIGFEETIIIGLDIPENIDDNLNNVLQRIINCVNVVVSDYVKFIIVGTLLKIALDNDSIHSEKIFYGPPLLKINEIIGYNITPLGLDFEYEVDVNKGYLFRMSNIASDRIINFGSREGYKKILPLDIINISVKDAINEFERIIQKIKEGYEDE